MEKDVQKKVTTNVKFLGNFYCIRNSGIWTFYDQNKTMFSTGWKNVEVECIGDTTNCIVMDEEDGYHLLKVGDKEIKEVVEESTLIEKANVFFFVKSKDGKKMLYDPVKETFIRDNIIVEYTKKIILSSKNGKFGVRTFDGKVLIAEQFDKIELLEGQKCFLVTNGNKKGIYGVDGSIKFFPIYEIPFIESINTPWRIKKGLKEGVYFYKEGRIIVPAIYDKIYIFDSCVIVGLEDGGIKKWGVYSLQGNLIVPVEFSSVKIHSDYIKVTLQNAKKENKYGLFNMEGIMILQCKYKKIVIDEGKVISYTR